MSCKSPDANNAAKTAQAVEQETAQPPEASEPSPDSVRYVNQAAFGDFWTQVADSFFRSPPAADPIGDEQQQRFAEQFDALIDAFKLEDLTEMKQILGSHSTAVMVTGVPGQQPWKGRFGSGEAAVECIYGGDKRPAECSVPFPSLPSAAAASATCHDRCCRLQPPPRDSRRGPTATLALRGICIETHPNSAEEITGYKIWLHHKL